MSQRSIIYFPVLFVAAMGLHLLPGFAGSWLESNIRDALHVIGFAVMTALFFRRIGGGLPRRFFGAFLAALLLAVCAEALQAFLRREGGQGFIDTFVAESPGDILRDVFGSTMILLALVCRLHSTRAGRTPLSAVSRVFSLLFGLAVFLPLAFWVGVWLVERSKEPVVVDLSGRWLSGFVAPVNATVALAPAGPGTDAAVRFLGVGLSRRQRSGVTITPAFRNWSGYSSLRFRAYLDTALTTVVTIHVNDRDRAGRFLDLDALTVEVDGTEAGFCVPLDAVADAPEQSDLADIGQLVFLARSRREGATLRLGDVRLSMDPCGTG